MHLPSVVTLARVPGMSSSSPSSDATHRLVLGDGDSELDSRLSKELDHELRFRVPMIIYKTHGEFEETNVSLEELPEAVGAFADRLNSEPVADSRQTSPPLPSRDGSATAGPTIPRTRGRSG